MTIDEFNNYGWSGGLVLTYEGEEHDIISVCFTEKLIAFQPQDNDQLTWVRCENATASRKVML